MQVIARELLQMCSCLDQPAQDGIRIGFKDASDRSDTDTLSQSGDGPYQLVGINSLVVKRGPHGFEEIAAAAQTHHLSPTTSIGVAIGSDITEADPAVVRTGEMRTEVASGID